jgi:type VI protein secretion system component Hcp
MKRTALRTVVGVVAGLSLAAGVAAAAGNQVSAKAIDNTRVVGRLSLAGLNDGKPLAIRGFAFGAANPGGTGKPTLDAVTVVRRVDAFSSSFVSDAATGRHRGSAVVELFTPGTQTAYVRYTLGDITLGKVAHDGDTETLALRSSALPVEDSIVGAPTPQLQPGKQIGSLALDGFAAPIAVADADFEIVAAPVGGGGGTGRPTIKPLAVELAHGSASPQLMNAVLTGKHLRRVTLTLARATYTLADATVTSVKEEASGVPGSIPTERIQLDAATVQVTTQ